jgi:hypothetical protein
MFKIKRLAARLRSRPALFAAVLGLITILDTTVLASGQLPSCDPNYVFHFGKVWMVLPTGTDDTANIQCAFDNAVTEQGSTLLLTAATYHTAQVAVFGFVGTFRGVGRDETIIKTLDRTLQVAPLNFFENAPTPESGSNPWPSIFAFVGGDIVISDLSFYSTPNVWTTGWTWTGLGITVYELAHGFVVVGPVVPGQDYTEANAALYRVRIEGVTQQGTLYGYDPITAVYYEGFFGAPFGQTLPLRGKFEAHDSEFQHLGCSTCLYNLYGARASITHNRSADSFEGMDMGGVVNTTYEYADNEVFNTSAWGVNLYGPFSSANLLVKNNVITGTGMGLYLDDTVTFAGDMKCRLLKNGVEDVNGVGIYLGSGVTGCLVVCKNPRDPVENLGTDNRLIGCQAVAASGNLRKSVQSTLHGRR